MFLTNIAVKIKVFPHGITPANHTASADRGNVVRIDHKPCASHRPEFCSRSYVVNMRRFYKNHLVIVKVSRNRSRRSYHIGNSYSRLNPASRILFFQTLRLAVKKIRGILCVLTDIFQGFCFKILCIPVLILFRRISAAGFQKTAGSKQSVFDILIQAHRQFSFFPFQFSSCNRRIRATMFSLFMFAVLP